MQLCGFRLSVCDRKVTGSDPVVSKVTASPYWALVGFQVMIASWVFVNIEGWPAVASGYSKTLIESKLCVVPGVSGKWLTV